MSFEMVLHITIDVILTILIFLYIRYVVKKREKFNKDFEEREKEYQECLKQEYQEELQKYHENLEREYQKARICKSNK